MNGASARRVEVGRAASTAARMATQPSLWNGPTVLTSTSSARICSMSDVRSATSA
jgi:hypothetical protein